MHDPTLRARFFNLAVPNILSNLMVPLAGMVDLAILGHLDEIQHLAGVALGAILFDYVYWSLGFLRMSTTGLVAQATGRSEPDEALRIALRGAALALTLGLVILAVRAPFRELGFSLLSGTAEVEASGRDYFDGRIWGAPATLLNLVFLGWFLGREQSRKALMLAMVGSLSNVVLDYFLIVRVGWASYGAGVATALSQYLTLLLALSLAAPELKRRLRASLRGVLEPSAVRRLFSLNNDIFVRTLALVSTFAVFMNVASGLGTVALASTAVLKNVVTLSAYFLDGFAYAAESLAGIYHGAGRRGQQRQLLRLATISSVLTALATAVAFNIFPQLLGVITDHVEVLEHMNRYVAWLYPVLLFGAVAFALDGYFIGLTAGRALMVSTVIATAVGFLPLAWWASRQGNLHMLWLAMSMFMLARAVTLALRVPGTLVPTADIDADKSA